MIIPFIIVIFKYTTKLFIGNPSLAHTNKGPIYLYMIRETTIEPVREIHLLGLPVIHDIYWWNYLNMFKKLGWIECYRSLVLIKWHADPSFCNIAMVALFSLHIVREHETSRPDVSLTTGSQVCHHHPGEGLNHITSLIWNYSNSDEWTLLCTLQVLYVRCKISWSLSLKNCSIQIVPFVFYATKYFQDRSSIKLS